MSATTDEIRHHAHRTSVRTKAVKLNETGVVGALFVDFVVLCLVVLLVIAGAR